MNCDYICGAPFMEKGDYMGPLNTVEKEMKLKEFIGELRNCPAASSKACIYNF